MISIHALREEGDVATVSLLPLNSISIHALREEGDAAVNDLLQRHNISIHALREEGDQSPRWFSEGDGCISIHALREEGDCYYCVCVVIKVFISIHALREEGDAMQTQPWNIRTIFLSTPSARRATRRHQTVNTNVYDFYPRPPRGGRQQKQRQNLYFQTNYTTFCTNLEEL